MHRLRSVLLLSFAYTIVLELMLVPAVYYWPDFEENIGALKLMAPIPALKDMIGQIESGGSFAYVASQHFFKGGNTVGVIAAILFAVGAVAGEAYRGTLEIWLARPHSRLRLLFERWLVGALATVLPVFVTAATIPWLGDMVDEFFALEPLMLASAHLSALLLAVYSLTFLASTIGSNPIRITLIALFLSALEFSIYFVKVVTHWSLFRLSDIQVYVQIERTGSLNATICGWFLGATVLFFVASVLALRRRSP